MLVCLYLHNGIRIASLSRLIDFATNFGSSYLQIRFFALIES